MIGGDYGFAWSRQGTNARDIGFFVQYYGYTPAEALRCATRNGGLLMTMGDGSTSSARSGRAIWPICVLVDGDPLADPSVLLNADRLVMIMKDGQVYKNTSGRCSASSGRLDV